MTMATANLSRRVPVKVTDQPATDRYVSVTTQWLHATTVYVVAEVDGTGVLAGQLRVFTDGHAATKHADKLIAAGRLKATQQPEHVEPTRSKRPRAKRMGEKRWRANVTHQGKTYKRTFGTEQEAQEFIDFIKSGGTPK
jgi:hypothetical protein